MKTSKRDAIVSSLLVVLFLPIGSVRADLVYEFSGIIPGTAEITHPSVSAGESWTLTASINETATNSSWAAPDPTTGVYHGAAYYWNLTFSGGFSQTYGGPSDVLVGNDEIVWGTDQNGNRINRSIDMVQLRTNRPYQPYDVNNANTHSTNLLVQTSTDNISTLNSIALPMFGTSFTASPSPSPISLHNLTFQDSSGWVWYDGHLHSNNTSFRAFSAPAAIERPVLPSSTNILSSSTSSPNSERGLIVVTHGARSSAESGTWASDLVDAISQTVDSTNWDVKVKNWSEFAAAYQINPTEPEFNPIRSFTSVAVSGAQLGSNLGQEIVDGYVIDGELHEYDRVHLIGHSAGSWLIQSAATTIQNIDPTMQTHLTFLDAFVPLFWDLGDQWTPTVNGQRVGTLGSNVDFAEHYFLEPSILHTSYELQQAFNVDLSGTTNINPLNVVSRHTWPAEWYLGTVTDSSFPYYEGWGFDLAPGVTGVLPSHSNYARGDCTALAVTSCSAIVNIASGLIENLSITGNQLLARSSTGLVDFYGLGFLMQNGSPVWASFDIDLENDIQGISLDVVFESESTSEGLLGIYWDDEIIAAIDQRLVSSLENLFLGIPDDLALAGSHTLTFRLDNYGDIPASVYLSSFNTRVAPTTQVPEPAAVVLFAIGLAGLGAARRKSL